MSDEPTASTSGAAEEANEADKDDDERWLATDEGLCDIVMDSNEEYVEDSSSEESDYDDTDFNFSTIEAQNSPFVVHRPSSVIPSADNLVWQSYRPNVDSPFIMMSPRPASTMSAPGTPFNQDFRSPGTPMPFFVMSPRPSGQDPRSSVTPVPFFMMPSTSGKNTPAGQCFRPDANSPGAGSQHSRSSTPIKSATPFPYFVMSPSPQVASGKNTPQGQCYRSDTPSASSTTSNTRDGRSAATPIPLFMMPPHIPGKDTPFRQENISNTGNMSPADIQAWQNYRSIANATPFPGIIPPSPNIATAVDPQVWQNCRDSPHSDAVPLSANDANNLAWQNYASNMYPVAFPGVVPPPVVTGPPPPEALVWHDQRPKLNSIPFTGNPGLKVTPPTKEPFDYFNLLATDEFYDLVINETNIYARSLIAKATNLKARIRGWKDINRGEFETFLGLLFLMGNVQVNKLSYYWKKSNIYNFPVFSKHMPRDRFLIILRALHFGRNPEDGQPKPKDPLYKIRPLINVFLKNMSTIYYPNKNLSLDESMVLWRGRLLFKQYIKNKRHKYGIKIYVLSEPNGLVLNCIIHTGCQNHQMEGRCFVDKVVNELLINYVNAGHAIYMDNFYNSVELSRCLLNKKTHTTGTLRANRRHNPVEVLKAKVNRGEVLAKYNKDGICVVKWQDKREVLLISTEHTAELISVKSRSGKVGMKPRIVAEYNKFMGGVDRSDQLLSYYPCKRKSLRWYLKLGIHFFQVMMNNSYCLFKKYCSSKIELTDFRESVIKTLLYRNRPYELNPRIFDPKDKKVHLPSQSQRTKRKRCRVCYKNGTRKYVRIFCPSCEDQPGLCLEPCFKIHHRYD